MKTVRADAWFLPRMKALWQRCFGDEETYVNQYFERFGAENGALCLEGDTLCAMALWQPVRYVQSDGDEQAGAYLYAVCTDPACRNRGCCRRVLAFAEQMLAGEGYDFTFLRPGSDAMATMYRKFGYEMTLTNAERTVPAQPLADAKITELTPEEYLAYRQMLLWDGFIDWQLPALAHQAGQGKLLSVTCGNTFAIAAVEQFGNLFIKEFLGEPSLAGAICTHFGVPSAILRTPGDTPFAMTKSLSGKPLPTGYPGFAFD